MENKLSKMTNSCKLWSIKLIATCTKPFHELHQEALLAINEPDVYNLYSTENWAWEILTQANRIKKENPLVKVVMMQLVNAITSLETVDSKHYELREALEIELDRLRPNLTDEQQAARDELQAHLKNELERLVTNAAKLREENAHVE